MKSAFSALELLVIVIVLCFICIIFSNHSNPIQNAVNERKELHSKQELIDSKLDQIQKNKNMQIKNLKHSMEQD